MRWATRKTKKLRNRLPRLNNFTIILLARQYYQMVMPERKSHRTMIWVAFFVASVTIAVQLLYPPDRAVPFAYINDRPVAFATHEIMAKQLTERFDKTKVKLTTKDKTVEYSLKTAGAEPNTERMIAQLTDYPFWQRFIPFSLVWQMPQVHDIDVYYTDIILREFSQGLSAKLSFAPTNARLAIHEGTLVATPEKSGVEVTAKRIHQLLANAELRLGATTVLDVPTKQLKAAHPMSEFAGVKTQAEAALKRGVAIKVDDKTFTPDKSEAASWLILDTASDGSLTLRVDTERIKVYIGTINKQVGTPAGQTNITIVDGRETGRTTGAKGRAINSDALAGQLSAFLLKGEGKSPFVPPFIELSPGIIFNSRYTATREGLQAYLDDTGRSKNMRIMIHQLDGNGWVVGTRINESIPSGSTYKLFVSLMLFDKMKKGEISWNDPMLDTNVSTCFDRMTIASTNPCAEKWLADWGRPNVNNFVYANGFSGGTSFTNPTATHSTAADLTKFMIGLNNGSLVSEPYRSRLLHSLSVHPYRYGIPTGSRGKVQDKVGFLWDYIHDTAIVKHPRGTYVMTIMTKGQSYAAIASVTREVERIMYP